MMNLKKMFFRDEQETSVDVCECWEVRWKSRFDDYHGCTKPEIRVFPIKEDAEEFKKALDDAYKLIKHTHGTLTTLTKQEI